MSEAEEAHRQGAKKLRKDQAAPPTWAARQMDGRRASSLARTRKKVERAMREVISNKKKEEKKRRAARSKKRLACEAEQDEAAHQDAMDVATAAECTLACEADEEEQDRMEVEEWENDQHEDLLELAQQAGWAYCS